MVTAPSAVQHMEMERVHQIAENADIAGEDAADGGGAAVRSNFPDQMRRRYEVYLTLPTAHKVQPMRSVTSHDLGALVKIKVRAPTPLRGGSARDMTTRSGNSGRAHAGRGDALHGREADDCGGDVPRHQLGR